MKWVKLNENTDGEDGLLERKASWKGREGVQRKTDAEGRECREQKGLETPVVYAVNDIYYW